MNFYIDYVICVYFYEHTNVYSFNHIINFGYFLTHNSCFDLKTAIRWFECCCFCCCCMRQPYHNYFIFTVIENCEWNVFYFFFSFSWHFSFMVRKMVYEKIFEMPLHTHTHTHTHTHKHTHRNILTFK